MKKYFFPLLYLIMALTHQSVHAYPKGCEVTGFGYSNRYLVLNERGKQTFYLIQNKSKSTIELQRHETRDVFMSPNLEALLKPSAWAGFASDVQDMYFQCYIRDNHDISPVPCQEVLDVCQYPRVKFALSNMGNYWVSVNKSQSQVIKEAIRKGLLLRW